MSSIDGVYAAAITPRRAGQQEVDSGALWDLIDFLGANKVNGIVLMGSTGEFAHYSIEDRSRFVGLTVKRSRVPILVNISHSTLSGAVKLAESAASCGAAGLLLMPPYYFRYRQPEILAFCEQFAKEFSQKIPVLLYNIPLFCDPLAVDTTARLLESGAFAGIKDSSGDWNNFEALKALHDARPFTLLTGHDSLYARGRMAGANGGISGVACAVPELMVALDRALIRGESELITRLGLRVDQFIGWLRHYPVPVGIKEAAALRGIRFGEHAVPLTEEQTLKLNEFQEWFRGWLPDVQRESSYT
jgi:4-hydroxy-tetrahydrodipicolinate synthase